MLRTLLESAKFKVQNKERRFNVENDKKMGI